MISALDVSRSLLQRVSVEDYKTNGNGISNLKMQKLLFYVQKINYSFTHNKLFEDDIQAWNHGPVILSVYKKYEKYKKEYINIIDELKDFQPSLSYNDEIILDFVMSKYNIYTKFHLVEMIHNDSAWKDIFNVNIKDQVIEPKTLFSEDVKKEITNYYNAIENIWEFNK